MCCPGFGRGRVVPHPELMKKPGVTQRGVRRWGLDAQAWRLRSGSACRSSRSVNVDRRTSEFCIDLAVAATGIEHEVLNGAMNKWKAMVAARMELPFGHLCGGGLLLSEAIKRLLLASIYWIGIESDFCDPLAKQRLQADGIFHRWNP